MLGFSFSTGWESSDDEDAPVIVKKKVKKTYGGRKGKKGRKEKKERRAREARERENTGSNHRRLTMSSDAPIPVSTTATRPPPASVVSASPARFSAAVRACDPSGLCGEMLHALAAAAGGDDDGEAIVTAMFPERWATQKRFKVCSWMGTWSNGLVTYPKDSLALLSARRKDVLEHVAPFLAVAENKAGDELAAATAAMAR